jgi:hypothetical protein
MKRFLNPLQFPANAFRQSFLTVKSISTGQTALHLATFYGHEEVVIELINHGASVNAADSSGYSSLHVTTIFITIISFLLSFYFTDAN